MISTTTTTCDVENGNIESLDGTNLMQAFDQGGYFEITDHPGMGLVNLYRTMVEDSTLNCTSVTVTPDNSSFGLAVIIVLLSLMFVGFLWNNLFKGKKGYDTTTL